MRYLGIDHGQVRIGVALSDPMGWIASPLLTHVRKRKRKQDLAELVRIAIAHEVVEIVIGIPYEMSGDAGKKANEVRQFADALRVLSPVPVVEWDERLTSVQAERSLSVMDVRGARRKELVDQMAAAIILQGYLDFLSMQRREEDPDAP